MKTSLRLFTTLVFTVLFVSSPSMTQASPKRVKPLGNTGKPVVQQTLNQKRLTLRQPQVHRVDATMGIPSVISFQGLVVDGNGDPIADGSHTLIFRLFDGDGDATMLWTETQSIESHGGVVAAALGSIAPFAGAVDFSAPYWLSIEVDNGGQMSPRIGLTSSPYSFSSLRSMKADSARWAVKADSSMFAMMAGNVDSARAAGWSAKADSAMVAKMTEKADSAMFAAMAEKADSAMYAMMSGWATSADSAWFADTSSTSASAEWAEHAGMADVADSATVADWAYKATAISDTANPTLASLNVTGSVTASSFSGDGGGLTNLSLAASADSALAAYKADTAGVAGYADLAGIAYTAGAASFSSLTAAIQDTANPTLASLMVTGGVTASSFAGDGSGLTNLSVSTASVDSARAASVADSAKVADWAYKATSISDTANIIAASFKGDGSGLTNIDASGSAWGLTGNSGTSQATNFIGTTDTSEVVFKVNNSTALRLVRGDYGSNLVGGSSQNTIGSGVSGTTVFGGSGYPSNNTAYDSYNTISGGGRNIAGSDDSDAGTATYATVGGGYSGTASYSYSTVSGGQENQASALASTVAGGSGNIASGSRSFVGGGQLNTASNNNATVAGGLSNTASGDKSSIGGGNTNAASAPYSTIGGGSNNAASGWYSAITGGWSNTAGGYYSFIGSGHNNSAGNDYSVVAGGNGNSANAANASVLGGAGNQASSLSATVGGGQQNTASSWYATVSGGSNNLASGDFSTVPGGQYNSAVGEGSVAMGVYAKANDTRSFVFNGTSTNATDSLSTTAAGQFLIGAPGGVGIGKNNPTSALDVNGTVTATAFSGDGSGLTGIDASSSAWGLSGNSGTNASTDFIGTTDQDSLTIKVFNQTVMRYQGDGTDVNVLGGNEVNSITSGVTQATIAGGGGVEQENVVHDQGGTIGGGIQNTIGSNDGDLISSRYATVGGGGYNTATGISSVIPGGYYNTASGDYSGIGGGNINSASGYGSMVPGGEFNSAAGDYSLAAGKYAKANHERSFVFNGTGTNATDSLSTTATGQFLIGAPGGVGIGTNAPTHALDVTGDIVASDSVYAAYFSGDGSGLTNLPSSGWGLTGNSGTDTSSNFIGTTDSKPLVLKANGKKGLVIDGTPTSPNILMGNNTPISSAAEGSTILGGIGNSFGGDGNYNVIVGGQNNYAGDYDNTGPGGYYSYGFVGGGNSNGAYGEYAVVVGGSNNTAEYFYSTVVGGYQNHATGQNAGIVSGYQNYANGDNSFIGAGDNNNAGYSGNDGKYSVVVGGSNNAAGGENLNLTGYYDYAFIGAGHSNTATGESSVVVGGYSNVAEHSNAGILAGQSNDVTAPSAAIVAGENNHADGSYSFIGAGTANTASGTYSAIPGGMNNVASSSYAVAMGEENNASGQNSLALGTYAKAAGNGSVVISANIDGASSDSTSTVSDEIMMLRADHGFYLTDTSETYTDAGSSTFLETSTGAYLSSGGTWTNSSDSTKKTNFVKIDPSDILAKLHSMPVTRWNYKKEDASIQHIGPMAQDFYNAFKLGNSDRAISTVDMDGVELAAIQALTDRNEQLEQRVAALEADRNRVPVQTASYSPAQKLESENAELRARVEKLEAAIGQLLDQRGSDVRQASSSGGGAASASFAAPAFSQEDNR